MKNNLLKSISLVILSVFMMNDLAAQTVTVGTGTSATGSYRRLFHGYYEDGTTQMYISASDLSSMSSGNIESIAFNAAGASAIPFNNTQVLIQTYSSNPSGNISSGWTTCYTGTVNISTGWNTITFDTPFSYTSGNGLLVKVCYDNSTWTSSYPSFYYTSASSTVKHTYADGMDLCSYTGGLNSSSYRPNMRFVCAPPQACSKPLSLASSSVTSSSATIGWNAPSSAPSSGYEYYYSTSSSAPTSGTSASGSVSAGTTSAGISSLTASTTYYFWVRSNCGSEYSDWTTSANFTTGCDVGSLPYSEGFNSGSIASCWSTAIVATQTASKLSYVTSGSYPTTSPQEGSHMVYYNSYSSAGGGSGSQERLMSGALSSSGSSNLLLDFYFNHDNSYNYSSEGIQPQYSVDGGTTWTDVGSFIVRYSTTLSGWTNYSLTLPSGADNQADLRVGFKFVSAYGNNMYLDNVQVYAAPVPTITSFTPSSICEGSTVTITGTNLTGISSVTIGGTAASSFTVNSATEISAVVGSGTTGTISVSNGSQSGTSTSSLTVSTAPTAVTVSAGSICSGSSINLTASGGSGGTIYWQGTSSGGTQDVTNSGSTSPAYTSAGTYYANAVTSAGCWGTEGSAAVSVFANPTNVTASSSAAGVCSGGTVNLTGSFDDSPGTIGTAEVSATALNDFPFSSLWEDARSQFLYYASDLNAAGLTGAASITSIAFNVSSNNSYSLNNFTIKMTHTSSSSISSFSAGMSTYYSATESVGSTGWKTMTLDTPFSWNGTDNLIIQICFDNTGYSGDSEVYWYAPSTAASTVVRSLVADADGVAGCSISSPELNGYYLPQLRFTATQSDTYSWSSDVGGFTSSDQNPTSNTISENTTYTLTASTMAGCTGTATAAVTYDQPTAIATTVDASSVSSGASFRLDQNIGWTSTNSSGIGFIWDADEASPYSNYNWAWTSPATWSDNAGSFLNGGDSRTLYLRARNVNNVTCYSDAVTAVLRKPLVSTSGTLSSFANCEGTAATEQSFTVTGQYLTNDLTVTAPTGFEVSASSGSGYASSITLTPTDGSVSATVYVQIPTTTSSGSPSGDITCASVHNLNGSSTSASATVSATGTVTAVPTITSSTGATICATGTAGLAATSSAGTINWYTASSGGSSQGTGTSFTTPSISATTIYYVDATEGSCTTGSRTAVTATVNSAPDAGTLTVDLTEALSTQTINWTNSGVSNGTRAYWYQWNDDNTSAPTGTWTDFGASTEVHSWGAGSAGSNMNRTLWVKTIVTTDQGCPGSPAESTPVYTDVINCKAGTTTASVSAGTVANMPFGETITYTSGTPGDGSFERFQFQWGATSGSWTDWSTSNPNAYTTDINAGQTLYVRSKIVGASVSGSATCTDYSNNIQTLLIDCASAVSASAGTDEDLCLGSSVALSGSGSGSNVSSYAWSPDTEISSTSSATPTVSATSTRTYTLTNTHDNGCTSTDDIIVTVTDVPTITTATDLTTVANTCGVTELSISHSGTGGNGAWTSSGGTVAFTSGSSTDASISVRPIPADVNTDITMIWTVDGGEACDGAITTKVIRFNQPTAISSPDTYCYLWGGLTDTDITTGDNWYKWNASTGVDMWERQSSPPGASTDKLHVLATDNNCIHATNTPIYASSVVANSLNVTSGTDITVNSGTLNITGDTEVAGTVTIASGAVLDVDGDFDATGGNVTFSGAGTLQVSSSTTSFGTLTTTVGTVKYDGSSAQTIFAGDYFNLEIDNSGTKSLGGNTTVNGDITLTDGELNFNGAKNLNVIGDITKTSGALVNSSTSNGYLILKATSSQNASQALCGFTAPSVSIKVQQSADVEITGDISANYLWVQSNNSGTFTIDNDYDLTVDNYIKVAGGTLNVVTGSLATTFNTSTSHELSGGTLDIDGGTVSFGSASNTTTDLNIDGGTLDISGGILNVSDCIDIASGTFTQSGGVVNVKTNTDVNGDSDHKFKMAAGTLNLTGGTMNLLGESTSSGKYSMSLDAGVTTTSTSGHTISISTNDASGDEDRYIDMGDASNDIGNLTFDLAGHELYFITNTDILGNLTATNGDIDISSLTVNVAGNAEFTNDDLKISTGILDVEGTFNSPNNTTFSDAGRLQLSGTVSDLGTMTNSVGTVEYDGGAQDIFQDTYFNLEIDGSGIKTLPTGNITVNGDLSLTEGSLNYNTGSSSKFITLKGSVLGTGTITASTTSIFSISGDGTNQDIRGISSDDIGVRLANSANATTSGDITCKYLDLLSGSTGTFTIDGETVTINPTGGYLEMDGGDLTVSSGSLIINSTSETTNELDAGTLTVSGGTVTFTGNSSSNTGGDLNVDGGTLTVSSGSISINDELDVGSGTINQTGGAIYVDAATNNSSGSSANKFDMAAGSLNLSGGTLYAQSQASSSYNCINIASGVSASIGSSHTFDIGTNSTAKNMYFNFGGHSIGNLTVNLPAKNAYLSEDLNIQGNVNIIDGTLVVDTHNPSVAGSTTVAGTLKIGAGSYDANGSFDASTGTIDFNNGNGQLYVSNSTVTSFGSLDDATGTVVYDGTSAQTIDEAETFYSLKVDNSSGVTLNEAVGVNGTLNMTSGNIVNPSNVLTVGSSAGAGSISHTSGIVTGKLRQYFANATGSKLFPIGNSTIMRDVTVDFTSAPGANQYLTASYNAGHPQANDGSDLYAGLPLLTSDGQLIQNYDDDGYWEIIPGSSSTGDSYSASINAKAYNVSLHCNDLTGADNVTNMDRTKVRVIKSAGPGHTSWEALTHVSVSGTDADFTLTGSGTGFSFFGAGTDDDNALPVELVSFNGSCNDGVVDLTWETASENNSEDFELEYSRDGMDWDLIHTEPAAGFSTELISYTYEHKQAISGDNYYRLTQNDIDGASVIYDNLIINASCQSTSNGYFSIFPNPSSGSFQVVMNNPEIEGAANLNITDTKGNKVFTKKIVVNSGINMYVIQQELAPGIYYINVENGARTTTIVKHSIR